METFKGVRKDLIYRAADRVQPPTFDAAIQHTRQGLKLVTDGGQVYLPRRCCRIRFNNPRRLKESKFSTSGQAGVHPIFCFLRGLARRHRLGDPAQSSLDVSSRRGRPTASPVGYSRLRPHSRLSMTGIAIGRVRLCSSAAINRRRCLFGRAREESTDTLFG